MLGKHYHDLQILQQANDQFHHEMYSGSLSFLAAYAISATEIGTSKRAIVVF